MREARYVSLIPRTTLHSDSEQRRACIHVNIYTKLYGYLFDHVNLTVTIFYVLTPMVEGLTVNTLTWGTWTIRNQEWKVSKVNHFLPRQKIVCKSNNHQACLCDFCMMFLTAVFVCTWDTIIHVRYHCGGWSEELNLRILLLAYMVYL
jgi:hypothetical protein